MNQLSAAENFLLERQASEVFTPTMVYLLAAAQKRMQSFSDARNTLAAGAQSVSQLPRSIHGNPQSD